MKRIEVDIGMGYEVALMIMFIHKHGLWEQYQKFKETEMPTAKENVHEIFIKNGWTKEVDKKHG